MAEDIQSDGALYQGENESLCCVAVYRNSLLIRESRNQETPRTFMELGLLCKGYSPDVKCKCLIRPPTVFFNNITATI